MWRFILSQLAALGRKLQKCNPIQDCLEMLSNPSAPCQHQVLFGSKVIGCQFFPSREFEEKPRYTEHSANMFAGTCSASSIFRPSCSVEECFLNLVSRRDFIPDHLWGLLQNRYPVFSQWIEWKGRYCMALPSADVIPARTRKLPLEVRELISKSFVECGWSHGHVPLLRYTPWLFFLVEVIVRYGWIPGLGLELWCKGFVVTGFIFWKLPFLLVWLLKPLVLSLVASLALVGKEPLEST